MARPVIVISFFSGAGGDGGGAEVDAGAEAFFVKFENTPPILT